MLFYTAAKCGEVILKMKEKNGNKNLIETKEKRTFYETIEV